VCTYKRRSESIYVPCEVERWIDLSLDHGGDVVHWEEAQQARSTRASKTHT
jgi:hypothetical protein